MKAHEIGYLTEGVETRYCEDVWRVTTSAELVQVLEEWAWCAEEALQIARRMVPEDFSFFREGLEKERGGEFAGEIWAERYAKVIMPTQMMKASIFAMQYKVPWGTAFIRMTQDCK